MAGVDVGSGSGCGGGGRSDDGALESVILLRAVS